MRIYAIRSGPFVKLGYTADVGVRLKSLQTGNAVALIVEWSILLPESVDHLLVERTLHKAIRGRRGDRGEWFRLNDDQLAVIKRLAEQLIDDYRTPS